MIKKGNTYLITGGTGIIGTALCDKILKLDANVIVLSRDEFKLKKLQNKYKGITTMVGDICDINCVKESMKNVSGVFHLAALAQGLQSGKATESVETNLLGTINILKESLNTKLDFIIGTSSDKAVQVSSVYGATKFLMEKLFLEFESMNSKVKYRIVRLGNVIYSIDSVLHKWKNLIQDCKEVIVTAPDATRFYITCDQSIDMILNCLYKSKDSSPYYEDMKSTSIGNLLKVMCDKYTPIGCTISIKNIGLQPGENMHEKICTNRISSDKSIQYKLNELRDII